MKRFFIAVIAALMCLSLCACGGGEDVPVQDGMKLAGKSAGNEAVDYSFTYPEVWSIIRNDGVIEIQYDCNDSDAIAEYATLNVLVFTLSDSAMGAKAYWEQHKSEVEKVFGEVETVETEELDTAEKYLDDSPALRVKYKAMANDRKYTFEQILCCRLGNVYMITLSAPDEYFDKVSTVIGAVKENFKFS